MPISFFLATEKFSIKNDPTKTLLALARDAGVLIESRCAGLGICGSCIVKISSGRYSIFNHEIKLNEDDIKEVLACRVYVLSDNATVIVPEKEEIKAIKNAQPIDSSLLLLSSPPSSLSLNNSGIKKIEITLEQSEQIININELKIKSICELIAKALYQKDKNINNIAFSLEALKKIAIIFSASSKKENDNHFFLTLFNANEADQKNQWLVLDLDLNNNLLNSNIYGLAIDIGTTIVEAALLDLSGINKNKTNNLILGTVKRFNQQILFANDIISRIAFCATEENLKFLQKLVLTLTINPLIEELCYTYKIKKNNIYRIVISGNTVMSHLLLGISPLSMGTFPFEPTTRIFPRIYNNELGLTVNPSGVIDIIPSIASYIGGDIVSDIYVSKLTEEKLANNNIILLLDIGTNGEIVLKKKHSFYACATAAGPVFEGASISCGSRAVAGAIDHIYFDEKLSFKLTTIADAPPHGICGSAVIDFLACGYRTSLLDKFGRMDIERLKKHNRYIKIAHKNGAIHGCIILDKADGANNQTLFITEKDIAEVLKAKAATYAGIKTLFNQLECDILNLDKIILAGSFANNLDITNAIEIGLLPDLPLEKYNIIGNGSLLGAIHWLLDINKEKDFLRIINLPKVIELNLTKEFNLYYQEALAIPYFDS